MHTALVLHQLQLPVLAGGGGRVQVAVRTALSSYQGVKKNMHFQPSSNRQASKQAASSDVGRLLIGCGFGALCLHFCI